MISIKRGDTIPSLSITCSDDGQVVDLSTATTINVIATRNGVPVFNRAASGTSQGVVTMAWQPADTSVGGVLQVEVEVVWPQPFAKQTFPASGYLYVSIEPDLG